MIAESGEQELLQEEDRIGVGTDDTSRQEKTRVTPGEALARRKGGTTRLPKRNKHTQVTYSEDVRGRAWGKKK